MQSIKVHELAPPTCVLYLFKTFDPSFLQCCSLFVHVHVLSLPFVQTQDFISFLCLYNLSPYLSYVCTTSPPLSSIFIKGMLLIDANVCIWDRWLNLGSCIFYGHHLIGGMTTLEDTTCNLYHLYLV